MSHNYIGSQLCLPTYPLAALQHPLPPHFAFLGVGGGSTLPMSECMCFSGHECKPEGLFLFVPQHLHAYVGVTHTHMCMCVCACAMAALLCA